jgi:signal transduction histidine kinase/CheY-like chemotaxis protein
MGLQPVPVWGAPGETGAPRVLKIGLSEYPRYGYKDAAGAVAGIDVEYAYRIAQYANLKAQIILIPDAETYFQSLDDGRVDMLFDAIKTKTREDKYLYASQESGNTPNSIYVRNDDTRFEYGNLEQLKGLTFGSEADSEVTKIFTDWCQKYGFQPKIVLYKDSAQIDQALTRQEIDAGVGGTDSEEGFRTIMIFAPTPYYIIFRKTDTELKEKIDEAMARISAEDPLAKDKLIQKYDVPNTYKIDAFTREEKEYLALHPTATVAVFGNDAPYYSLSSNGQPQGILPDFYAKLAASTGLKFQFVVYKTQQEAVEAVKSGQTDIIGLFSDGMITANHLDLRLTRPYAATSAVEVTRAGSAIEDSRSIAVKTSSINTIRRSLGTNNNIRLLSLPTSAACFSAVQNGQARTLIVSLPSATWIINQAGSQAFSMTPLANLTIDLCGAVAQDNSILCSILDKAIHASEYSFSGIVANNTLPEDNWRTFISRIPAGGIAAFSIIMLMLVLALGFTIFTMLRRQKEVAALNAAKAATTRRELQVAATAKSNEERNQFFSNISHDMRTPLNAIIGFADLAQEKVISPVVKDYLSKIQSSGNLLLDLINDTLTISKVSSGKLKLNLQPLDTQDLMEALVVPVKAAAEAKHITFTYNDTTARSVILADRLNLEKIFLNLLTNAVKYTPKGGKVEFKISEGAINDTKSEYILEVKDNGIGISKDFLPHIYEPFVQENRTSTFKTGGTGLGLAIVKQLVDLMGGSIEVQSSLNQGTTFTVKLSFAKAETRVKTASALPSQPQTDLSGRKLLLCEDNALNAEIACALLKAKSLTVVVAEDGQKGVEAFENSGEQEYAAILMDLRMPVMNGYEATAKIRSLSRRDARTIPIIAMTADAFEDDVQKCLDAGMDAHLAKPLNPSMMYQTLSKYLN